MSPHDHITVGGPVMEVVPDRPPANAINVIRTWRVTDVRKAKQWGLIRVAPREHLKDHLMDHAHTLAHGIAEGAPLVTKAPEDDMRHMAYASPEEAHQGTPRRRDKKAR